MIVTNFPSRFVLGDDYTENNGRRPGAITYPSDSVPVSGLWRVWKTDCSGVVTHEYTFPCNVSRTDGETSIELEITASQWENVEPGLYEWAFEVTDVDDAVATQPISKDQRVKFVEFYKVGDR